MKFGSMFWPIVLGLVVFFNFASAEDKKKTDAKPSIANHGQPAAMSPVAPETKPSECSEKNSKACLDEGLAYLARGKRDKAGELIGRACDYGQSQACVKWGVVEEKSGNKLKAKEFYLKECKLKKKEKCRNADAMDELLKKD